MTKFGTVDTQTDLTGGGTLIINGTRPPTDTDGAVGDYWLDTAGKTLYGPKGSGPTYGSDQMTISAASPPGGTGAGTFTYGLKFRALVTGRITGLRYYRMGAIPSAHTITLLLFLQSSQAELGRSVINNASGAGAGWIVGALTAPVDISAGQDYRVGYSSSVGSVSLATQINYAPTSAVPTVITLNGNCYRPAVLGYPNNDNTDFFFVDVVFQALVSPTWPIAIKSAP